MKFSKTLLLALVAGALAKGGDEICKIDEITGKKVCYPKIFVPSKEWQIVWPDQIIPAGLHVRMDYEKGIKEAKINDPNEEVEGVAVALGGEEIPEDQIVIEDLTGEDESNDNIQKKVEKAMREKHLKQGTKPNPNIPQSDHQRFSEAVAALKGYKIDGLTTSLSSALSHLEDLSHEIEFGVALCDPEPLASLLAVIKDSKLQTATRIMAARTIGASVRNNFHALDKLLGHDSIDTVEALLNDLQESSKQNYDKLSSSIIYALSGILKTPDTLTRFVDLSGGEVLRKVFHSSSAEVKGKVSTLIGDTLATPDLHLDFDSITGAVEKRSTNWWNNELKQWSAMLQKSLSSSELTANVKPKVYHSLSVIRRNFPDTVEISQEFLEWIDNPKKALSELGEDLEVVLREERDELWGNPKARKFDARDEL